jgi:peptidoglycan/LPS O-acetylase OafA/YrhL
MMDRPTTPSTIKNEPSRKFGFVPRLESLRGIAAVSVVGYHAAGSQYDTHITGLAPVVLFFVLSGFVLARSLENDPSPTAFFWSRAFRLFPPAAATVLLLAILYHTLGFFVGYKATFDFHNIVLNALMIRHDINGVMWSMTVECFATPLIFASVAIHRRWGKVPLLTLIVTLFALSFWGPYVHLLGGFTTLAPLYAFVDGVLLQFKRPPFASCKTVTLVSIGSIALLCFCGLRKQTAITILLECIGSGILIFLIAGFDKEGPFRLLDATLVRFYGRISFSFYLLHPIGLALSLATLPISAYEHKAMASLLVFLLAVAYTTPIAFLFRIAIEEPFINLRKATRLI